MRRKINKVYLVLGTIILLVAITSCVTKPSDYVGKVNDRFVTNEMYMSALRNQYESFYLETGFAPDDNIKKRLGDKAFSNIVEGIVFQEQLRKYGVYVTEKEVIKLLLDEVPELIVKSKRFEVDGKFDKESYRQSLETNKPYDLSWLVKLYFDIYAPMRKLKERVQAEMPISEQEIANQYLNENSIASASLIAFYYDDSTDIAISDQEIENYYKNHKDKYLLDPYVKFQYIIFPLQPSEADFADTKVVADSIYQELKVGMPFSILASKYSDSPTATNNGELGFMEISSLPEAVQNEVNKLKLEGFTKPFSTKDGWVLYQLMGRTKNLVKLREIYLKHKASPQTQKRLNDEVVGVRSLAFDVGLQKAAQEYDKKVLTSGKITPEDPYIPQLGKSDSIVERGIKSEVGTIFEPLFHSGLQAYVLVLVVDSQKRDYIPLYRVSSEIREDLARRKKVDLILTKAQAFAKKNNYNSILTQAEKENYDVFHLDNFNWNSYFPQANVKELVKAMFEEKKGRLVSKPVEGENGVYVGVVHNFYPADKNAMTSEDYKRIRNELFNLKKEKYFSDWQQEQQRKVKIRDWRS